MKYLTTREFCSELKKRGIEIKIPNLTRIIKANQIEAKKSSNSFSERFIYMIPESELKKFSKR
jgi:hypothetical protein